VRSIDAGALPGSPRYSVGRHRAAGTWRQTREEAGLRIEDARALFAALVTPNLPDALALARWITRNRADAEDILQEACLRAFRSIRDCSGRNSARAWTLTIVRNTAYSWLARNRRPEIMSIEDLGAGEREELERDSGWGAGQATPESDLIVRSDAVRLRRAIDSLPLGLRETLVLREINGLNYREIAEVTSAPVGTVMSRLSRARRALIGRLGQDSPG
jgi:RNA polymerase sigma factor (sigma-70 family)